MKYSARTIVAIGTAPMVALVAAVLAHVVRMPPFAVRDDSLGVAACLAAFVAAGLFVQWRDKR
jgi:hypothetical protein